MCTGNCKDIQIYGKKYIKPRHLISSLLTKRRVNRRSKEPSVYLDAILTNTIISLKYNKSKKVKHLSTKSSKVLFENKHKVDSYDVDEDIDDLCGINSFFDKLKDVGKKDIKKNINISDGRSQFGDNDNEIHDLVNHFIETGKILETSLHP